MAFWGGGEGALGLLQTYPHGLWPPGTGTHGQVSKRGGKAQSEHL